jgi:hypothetical protein
MIATEDPAATIMRNRRASIRHCSRWPPFLKYSCAAPKVAASFHLRGDSCPARSADLFAFPEAFGTNFSWHGRCPICRCGASASAASTCSTVGRSARRVPAGDFRGGILLADSVVRTSICMFGEQVGFAIPQECPSRPGSSSKFPYLMPEPGISPRLYWRAAFSWNGIQILNATSSDPVPNAGSKLMALIDCHKLRSFSIRSHGEEFKEKVPSLTFHLYFLEDAEGLSPL